MVDFGVIQATREHIPRIIDLYRAGLIELGLEYCEYATEEKVNIAFELAPCFLLVVNDNIVGIAGFTMTRISHTGDISLADYMFYIEPDYRNIKTLGALVESAKDFALRHKLPLRVDFTIDKDAKLRERVLKMHGFEVSSISGVYNG